MNKISLIIHLIIFSFLLSSNAHSFSSSSYLIAQSAITLNDYEIASKHYEKGNLYNLHVSDLKKKLIAFVNSNYLFKASIVARELIDLDVSNQEAWVVYLANAKLINELHLFKEFENQEWGEEYNIVKYIYYSNDKLRKNNNDIARAVFEVIQASSTSHLNKIANYDYLLFYTIVALNFNPIFNEALFSQAYIYEKIKNYDKAEQIYQKINNSSSFYLEAQKNIAFNKIKNGNIKEAEKILTTLIQNNRNNNALNISLADFYRITKQYDLAISHYTDIIQLKNIDSDQLWQVLYMRGICFERVDQWGKAEKDFLSALEIDPDIPQILNYLAYGWIERNIFINRSLEMLKKAVKINPDSHYILDSLAWAYFKNNDLAKAVESMEKVIKMAPGEAISLDHLGDIYFALDRKREAYFMWNQANDLAEPEDGISDSVQLKLQKYNAG